MCLLYIVGSPDARRGTIVFLHGAPTQSFSYRVVMAQVSLIEPVDHWNKYNLWNDQLLALCIIQQ